jgi:homoserine O-succinyltransferase
VMRFRLLRAQAATKTLRSPMRQVRTLDRKPRVSAEVSAVRERLAPRADGVAVPRADEVENLDARRRRRVRIGLLNNTPDHLLRTTERRFEDLLIGSAPWLKIELLLYSLQGISRTKTAMDYVTGFYRSLNELRADPPDALIVTGTEPRAANLIDEPYWEELEELLDWADGAELPTVLSCLAAQAAVLHFDGIRQRPLPQKCCGVFNHRTVSEHPLMVGMPEEFAAPHSRFTGVDAEELHSHGYELLAVSEWAGVHLFATQRRALMVFLQGHPEYGALDLVRDYHRDIRRFVRGEQERYPVMPCGYFNSRTEKVLEKFRTKAEAHRSEAVMLSFPRAATERRENTWSRPGTTLFRNWLEYVWRNGHEARESKQVFRFYEADLNAARPPMTRRGSEVSDRSPHEGMKGEPDIRREGRGI